MIDNVCSIGRGWTAVMPDKNYSLLGRKFNLNPCPFNKKEHTIITVMTAAGAGSSYAIDILLAQEIYYGQYFQWGFQILLIISTQAMGYAWLVSCDDFWCGRLRMLLLSTQSFAFILTTKTG